MKKLRLGLLGSGLAADMLSLPALKPLKGRIEIVACCNRTRSKAERFAKKAGVPLVVDKAEQLIALPQVDAVVIALPIEQQPRYVLKALNAGKAVLSEKPVGPSVKAGAALVQAAKKYKAPWLVAENYAFMPQPGPGRSLARRRQTGRCALGRSHPDERAHRSQPLFPHRLAHRPQVQGRLRPGRGRPHRPRSCGA